MEKKNGPWTIKAGEQKYKNDFFTVTEDDVINPDGSDGKYAVITMKPGVAILPIDTEGNVYLTRQFRYAYEAESLETPCGGIDGEAPLMAAKRESCEELGIQAEEWIELGAYEMDTSIIRSPAYLFIAKKLKFTEPEREGSEQIKMIKMSLAEAAEKVMSGEVTHAISAILILKAYLLENK
jgi:8-oxo-dGTP pyrophosphatase MutT (NUDIX family)